MLSNDVSVIASCHWLLKVDQGICIRYVLVQVFTLVVFTAVNLLPDIRQFLESGKVLGRKSPKIGDRVKIFSYVIGKPFCQSFRLKALSI